ncbi:MAG: GntR family transcriptional regulator [Vulcanimicrobiaceae bacterium]
MSSSSLPAIFSVDPRSGVPLYLQLSEQIKRAVALGTLAPGEQLPTVRTLAIELTINPNTIARVYRELEREGVIETSPGRGSFVSANGSTGAARRSVIEVAERAISAATREARSLGVSRAEAGELAARAIDRWYPSEDET